MKFWPSDSFYRGYYVVNHEQESGIPEAFESVKSPIDFRVNPNKWTDQESAAKALSLNTVESYFSAVLIALTFTLFIFGGEILRIRYKDEITGLNQRLITRRRYCLYSVMLALVINGVVHGCVMAVAGPGQSALGGDSSYEFGRFHIAFEN